MPSPTARTTLLLLAALGLASSARATTLTQMSLRDLARNAGRIFRGTVVAIDTGTVEAGGGALPIVTYRLSVDEAFKGDFPPVKSGGPAVVEIRMVGTKDAAASGATRRLPVLRDVPRLVKGQDYVLFTTEPSRIGLSTTVGLGQGAFVLVGGGKEQVAVNAFNNTGLARGLRAGLLPRGGPVPYGQLAQAIRSVLAE